MPTKLLIVSSSDTKFFGLLKDMILSLERLARLPTSSLPPYALGIIDLGLSDEDRAWLAERGAVIVVPRPHMGAGSLDRPLELAFLVRPFLPEYFPDFEIYCWIDSDVWLQNEEAVLALVDGAASEGMAIAHENERAYRFQRWLFLWTAKHFVLGYGALRGAWLLTRPHLNAGMFAIHAGAPHWEAWARRYKAAIVRTGKITPHDQFALNQAVYQDRLPTRVLDAGANWICDRGVPMWNDDTGTFCTPYAPYKTISALHLAGPGKRTAYRIGRTGGGNFTTMIRYGAAPKDAPMASPAGLSVAAQ
ncbi:MAG TPA: hypothetical protein VGV37_05160 [Aliidongia sp.]|uniref:hypothetical protein n=1 Tax=Aliidongia sp. TaxID=1914230 RepID=UPI002DDD2E48|nr:hypothetical protein [Aliidongia sp.]HEV2673909.1 hypothetical protein [Aliidongia sp.]